MLAIGVRAVLPCAVGRVAVRPASGGARLPGSALSVIVGAFIFGMGMQLGGGCASGHALHGGRRQHAHGDHADRIHRRLGGRHSAHAVLLPSLPQLKPFSMVLALWPVSGDRAQPRGVRSHRGSDRRSSRNARHGRSLVNDRSCGARSRVAARTVAADRWRVSRSASTSTPRAPAASRASRAYCPTTDQPACWFVLSFSYSQRVPQASQR